MLFSYVTSHFHRFPLTFHKHKKNRPSNSPESIAFQTPAHFARLSFPQPPQIQHLPDSTKIDGGIPPFQPKSTSSKSERAPHSSQSALPPSGPPTASHLLISKRPEEPREPPMIRILIVDDHELVRRGVRTLLSSRSDFQVVGEASDGLQGVDRANELRPDIVLMDISMPNMNGLDATRQIRRALPDAQVILVSQNESSVVQRQTVEVDARAFVAKSNIAIDLIPTIERVTRDRRTDPEAAPLSKGLYGGSELSRLISEYDWSSTPIGPIESWPHSLKNAVNLMLNSQHPMWIGWGPTMTFLYNDAYLSVLGLAKHPAALGRPASEVWAEIWDICGPLADKVFAKGEPTFVDNVQLFMNRGNQLEETYYSFSYSPIFDESGKVTGLFCPSSERTANILNARRLRTLSDLSSKALLEKSADSACDSFLATLGNNPDDIPFALLYLMEPGPISGRAILQAHGAASRNTAKPSPLA